ncbi:MAG: hypothetical protein KAW67_06490 [Candidatus Eisenbacteria sp.]|nr:hypothetical protein [Candidatus Eisenbacteria bacterium]
MREVHERLHIGTEHDCFTQREGWAVVHACKSPCHQRAVGYRGNLSKSHRHYLVLERGNNLYLNMIDPPAPLFKMPLFHAFLQFAGRHWDEGDDLLIHCNLGMSRAPSLALVFLAKHTRAITDDSYATAAEEFAHKVGGYHPSEGIRKYLARHWDELAPA